MKILCFFFIFIIFVCVTLSSAGLFSAIFKLKETFKKESTALDIAEEYLKKPDVKKVDDDYLVQFERFIEMTKKEHERGVQQGEGYMEHPINIYHVIKRMAEDWQKHIKYLGKVENKVIREFHARLINITNSAWPSMKDRKGVELQFIRLQGMYQLDIHQLATGTLNGTKTDPLSLDEIFDIGSQATNQGLFYEAAMFFEGLMRELQNGGKGERVTLRKVVKRLASAYFQYGNLQRAVQAIEEALKTEPSDTKLQDELAYYKEKLQHKQAEGEEVAKPLRPYHDDRELYYRYMDNYFALCRGDVRKKESVKKKLKCVLRRTSVPYRPAKIEIVNNDPLVTMFHDVIYDDEIEQIKRMAKEIMEISEIVSDQPGIFEPDYNYRVSMTGWLDDDSRLTARITRRVEEKTGLSTKELAIDTHAESLQVLNYGIGGMYRPHLDYFLEDFRYDNPMYTNAGNRIATWMFYLSDVKAGGNTVFPGSDTIVPVVKGAAAFWPNMFMNGTVDSRTVHAGCPVIIGSKWVMNKWIRSAGQFDRWRCSKRRKLRSPLCIMLGKKC